MAITSYATLKTAIGDWLARSDLATVADDFIDLAEARINRDLRVSAMETALSESIASGVVAVPTGFLEFVSVYIDGTPTQPLEVKSPHWIERQYPQRASDSKPRYVARSGGNFIFGPYPDSAYTVAGTYYAKFTPLGDGTGGTATTNFLITDAPDLILFAALVESAPYVGDDARLSMWHARYAEALETVDRNDKAGRFSNRIAMRAVAS